MARSPHNSQVACALKLLWCSPRQMAKQTIFRLVNWGANLSFDVRVMCCIVVCMPILFVSSVHVFRNLSYWRVSLIHDAVLPLIYIDLYLGQHYCCKCPGAKCAWRSGGRQPVDFCCWRVHPLMVIIHNDFEFKKWANFRRKNFTHNFIILEIARL